MPYKVWAVNEILTAADMNSYVGNQTVLSFSGTAARATAIGTPVEGMVSYVGSGVVEVYAGTAGWTTISGGGGGGGVTVGTAAPDSPSDGALWWDSGDGELYLYYDDGSSQQWVSAAGPSVAVQDTAPTGYEGQLWLDSTDGSMYTYYTDPGGTASSWIGAVSRSGGILQVVNSTYDTLVSTTSTSFVTSGLSASITPRSTSSKILILAYTNGYHASTAGRARYTLFRGTVADTNLSSEGTLGTVFNPNASGTESVVHLNFLDSPSTTSTVTYTLGLRTTSASGSVSAQFSNTVSSMTLIEVAG